MKKVILRIFAFTLALYISFLSVFNSFHVNVYASGAVPNPNGIPPELLEQLIQQGIIEQTYKYISEEAQQQIGSGGGSYSPFPNVSKQGGSVPTGAIWNPYIQSSLELAMMQIAANNGFWDGVAATEDQAIRMTKDFCTEYGDDVFKALVIDPSNAAKELFWNYPNEAVGALLEASEASIISIADNYVIFSESFLNKLKSFAQARVKDGVYYPLSDDPDISRVNGKIDIPTTYHYSGIRINSEITSTGEGISQWTNFNGQNALIIPIMCRQNYGSYYLYNIYNLSLIWNSDHFDYYQLVIANTCNLIDIISSDFYVFDYDTLKNMVDAGGRSDGWFEKAVNYKTDLDNVVLPVNHPVAVTAGQAFPIPGLAQAIQSSHDLAGQNRPDSGTYPVPVPDPVPAPVPVPDPVPIVDILPIVDPEPGTDPVPNPDPGTDPVPNPDPNPEDPDNPSPNPDPDIDIPDDWGGSPLMDLSGFFPFCLPMDLYLAFTMLTAEAEPPVFEIPVNISLSGVNQSNYQDVIVIDIIQPAGQGSGSAEPYVKYLRFFLTFLFIVFLIFTSIKITPH